MPAQDGESEVTQANFKIIKDAAPPPALGHRTRWPFDQMEIGDAFDAPMLKRNNLAWACTQRKNRNGEEYTVRKISDDTVRVWRIA